MATRIVDQLRQQLATYREKLAQLEAALDAVEALESADGGGRGRGRPKASADKGTGKTTRRPRTEEQKAAQSARMKKIWAAKKKAAKSGAGKKARKTAAKKAPRKSVAKKIAENTTAKEAQS
jgi:hypothetical protein